jgi:hydroxymethylglutaryl-CoA synthase
MRSGDSKPLTVDHFDYFAFHSPYNKLVQKGFCRLFYSDYLFESSALDDRYSSVPEQLKAVSIEDSYENRDIEAAFKSISNERFGCFEILRNNLLNFFFNIHYEKGSRKVFYLLVD